MRRVALLTLLVPALAWAGQAPPRGKRTPRPKATHLVVSEAELQAGAVKMTLSPGVAVAAGAVPAKGKAKVTVVGQVIVTGTVDASALGKRALVEAELKSIDGKTRLGTVRPGALLRLSARKKAGPAGMVAVETVGAVTAEGSLPADALGTEARDVVLKEDWSVKTGKLADLFPTPEVKGPPVAKLAKDARLVLVEQKGEVSRVRTHGGVAIEGWTLTANLDDRQATDQDPPAPRIKPTHEIFVDAPLYGDSGGKKPLATVRGGALVQAEKLLVGDPSSRLKVKVLGGVQAAGYMKLTDLRKLEDSVWSEESK